MRRITNCYVLWNSYRSLFISCFYSGDKLVSLYEALQTSEASPHLVSHFEEVISALMSDVKKIDESKRNMEEKIKR